MKQIEVVAAIIHDAEGCVFATQRGYGEWKDWWEFPGGKMEGGGVEARDLGGTGDACRGGAAGGDGGMGLSAVSSDHALLPLSRRKRTPGTKGARGGEVVA